MKKAILIVGAGFGQLPAIETAKKLDLQTIVVDVNPDAVGASLADFFYEIDVVDRNQILNIAKKHNVSGAMTMQSDLPVPTIGYINDTLNLKGVSLEVANNCSNKLETRMLLKQYSSSSLQPNFKIVSTLQNTTQAIKEIGFPCVVKAPDSSGSRGVTKVNNEKDIENAFNEAIKYSRKRSILVEEYIDGLEFGAQTFSVNGKCECVLLHSDTMSPPPFMIPIGHSFPFTLLTETEQEIAISDIKMAIDAVGITDGPANIDLILDVNTNRVKIIEIGARIGATCLPELVFFHTGLDWVEKTICNAIGEDVDLKPKYNKPVAAMILESPSDGIYQGYELKDKTQTRNLIDFEITVNKGDSLSILKKGTDRIGKVLAYGENVKFAENIVNDFRNNIRILVD